MTSHFCCILFQLSFTSTNNDDDLDNGNKTLWFDVGDQIESIVKLTSSESDNDALSRY